VTQAESLAGQADVAGRKDLAHVAYHQIGEVCKEYAGEQAFLNDLISPLLLKLADLCLRRSQPMEATSILFSIFQRCPPGRGHDIEPDVWQMLRKALPKSSETMSAVLQQILNDIGAPAGRMTAYPPVHTLLRSGYGPYAPGYMFEECIMWDITGNAAIHTAITEHLPDIFQIITILPEKGLLIRDVYFRTPLRLAIELKREDIGLGLLTRFASQSEETRRRLTNDRDAWGTTMLFAALVAKCSLSFLEALIDNFAEVNPPLLENHQTPLQIAAQLNYLEAVALLMRSGAKINWVWRGTQTARDIAEQNGFLDVARLLAIPTHVANHAPRPALSALVAGRSPSADLRPATGHSLDAGQVPHPGHLPDVGHSANAGADLDMLFGNGAGGDHDDVNADDIPVLQAHGAPNSSRTDGDLRS
jgi:hypothetical protein